MISEDYNDAMKYYSTDKQKCIEKMETIINNCKDKKEYIEPYIRISELCRETDIKKSIKMMEYLVYKTNDYGILNSMAVLYNEDTRLYEAKRLYVRIIKECKDPSVLHISLCNFNQMMDLYIYDFIAYIHLTLKLHPELSNELKCIIHQALLMEYNGVYTKNIENIISILEHNEITNKKDRQFIDYKTITDVDIDNIYNEHLKINDYFKIRNQYNFSNKKKNKKIRIGYVSSDFRNHAVSKFMKNIILNHNKNKFEIFSYYVHNSITDKYTDIYKNNTTFKDISKLSVKESCDVIFNDNIDILIDLNGHTGFNRLEIFAYKPAPVQITYLGYPNTTGLHEMDYRITDKIADPLTSKQKYSEKLLYLDTCFLNYSLPDYKYTKYYKDNKDNIITYGITNRLRKQCPIYLETIKQILHNKPNSKIKILIHSLPYKKKFVDDFYQTTFDIDSNRIEVITNIKDEDYFNYFKKVDIILDTFPYSAATIACDSLFMGTPIITLSKEHSHVHNVSKTVLYNVAPELITYSLDEYINKAITMDTNTIKKYKNTLHKKFCNSMDIKNFIKSYENILLSVYNKPKKSDNINYENIDINDIITGEKIQLYCDHFLGLPDDFNFNPKISSSNKCYNIDKNIETFDNKSKVFVYTHRIQDNRTLEHLKNFKNKFNLILHNSDNSLSLDIYDKLKDIKNIQHIFSQNIKFKTPFISSLPIGIANSMWKHGQIEMFNKIKKIDKNKFIYFNFNVDRNSRLECMNRLLTKIDYVGRIDNYEEYLNLLNQYKYAICPEGNGIDTHRLFECLYLNVIPICLKSVHTEYYSHYFPIILLDKWDNLNIQDLKDNYYRYNTSYKNNEIISFKNVCKLLDNI